MQAKLHSLLFALASFVSVQQAFAQGTAFTYQGQLLNGSAPANGSFDFIFELFNASTGGAQQGLAVTNLGVGVSNGLFVVKNDFGDGPWTGQPLWMQLLVRTNNGGAFTALTSRQGVTSAPYAIQALYASNAVFAVVAGSANTVAASNISGVGTLPAAVLPSFVVTNTQAHVVLSGAFNGNGAGLTNLNASQLSSGTVADAQLSTNVAFLNQSQAFRGNNTFGNTVAISTGSGAAALSVGGSITGGFGTPLSLLQNTSTAANASPTLRVVGHGNTPDGVLSVSSQGTGLIAQFGNGSSFVAQLDTNGNWTANSFNGSGSNLTGLNASQLTGGVVAPNVLPGYQSSSNYSTVGGGQLNVIGLSSDHSVIGGGWQNSIGNNDYEGAIAGGYLNTLLANSAYAAVGGGQANAAGGEWAAIGGGNNNTNYGNAGTIAGGQNNLAGSSYQPTIGGGYGNTASGNYDTIAGGEMNAAIGLNSTVGGGFDNSATGNYAAIGGGRDNLNSGASGTISGGNGNSASGNQPTVGGGYANSATANYAFVGGGHSNTNNGVAGVIGGGYLNAINSNGSWSVISGGSSNLISSNNTSSFIGGGTANYIGQNDAQSVIGGGISNNIQEVNGLYGSGRASFIGGGANNIIEGGDSQSAIVGGVDNNVGWLSSDCFIAGGSGNSIQELTTASIILGGSGNLIGPGAQNSLAAGYNAVVNAPGCFVWSDSSSTNQFANFAPNTFNVRATGGIWLDTGGQGELFVDGNQMASIEFVLQTVSSLSDRTAKENFAPVDNQAVLDKVLGLPLTSWNYKDKGKAIRHLGPMAQDFHAAFGLNGEDDKHIAVVDEGGVALAAIQGLNEKVDEKDAKIQEQDAEIEKLKAKADQVDSLEQRLNKLEQKLELLARQK